MKATSLDSISFPSGGEAIEEADAPAVMSTCDLETLFARHADFVFRTCRHLGLDRAGAEDATQQVFLIAARRLGQIPDGKERAFLFVTARNIVANARRTVFRRARTSPTSRWSTNVEGRTSSSISRARVRWSTASTTTWLSICARRSCCSGKTEQLTFTEISELLGIPRGTVASRVRRARDDVEARVQRTLARSRGEA